LARRSQCSLLLLGAAAGAAVLLEGLDLTGGIEGGGARVESMSPRRTSIIDCTAGWCHTLCTRLCLASQRLRSSDHTPCRTLGSRDIVYTTSGYRKRLFIR
jgi:hypothetical protein